MDREKVIRDLRYLKSFGRVSNNPQITEIAENAIALLKEKEAIQVDLYGKEDWWGLVCECPDCKAVWMSDKENTHFCPNCRRSVKWE